MPKTKKVVEVKNDLLEEILKSKDLNREEVLGYIVGTIKNDSESNFMVRGRFNKKHLMQITNNLIQTAFDLKMPDWVLGNSAVGQIYYAQLKDALNEVRLRFIKLKLEMLKDDVLVKDPDPSENADVDSDSDSDSDEKDLSA